MFFKIDFLYLKYLTFYLTMNHRGRYIKMKMQKYIIGISIIIFVMEVAMETIRKIVRGLIIVKGEIKYFR